MYQELLTNESLVMFGTVQLYVDGFCSFDITRNCNKLMYQELLTNNCLGNVN